MNGLEMLKLVGKTPKRGDTIKVKGEDSCRVVVRTRGNVDVWWKREGSSRENVCYLEHWTKLCSKPGTMVMLLAPRGVA